MSKEFIRIGGAREHNLKNLTLNIPRDKLVNSSLLYAHVGQPYCPDTGPNRLLLSEAERNKENKQKIY